MDNEKLKTIGNVAEILQVKQYVLRFWESQLTVIKPIKRNKRRLYSNKDIKILQQVKYLLYTKGLKIKAVQKQFQELKKEINKNTLENTNMQNINTVLDNLKRLNKALNAKLNNGTWRSLV